MIDTWCPICFRTHHPHCNAGWDEQCFRCGLPIGGPAAGVPYGLCWRCHMDAADDAYDRPFRDAFREPETP